MKSKQSSLRFTDNDLEPHMGENDRYWCELCPGCRNWFGNTCSIDSIEMEGGVCLDFNETDPEDDLLWSPIVEVYEGVDDEIV